MSSRKFWLFVSFAVFVAGLFTWIGWSLMNRNGKTEAAWDRIMALGGSGVWDNDMVVVTLADTPITDGDLAVFRDFPLVQTLDLSRTKIRGNGLTYLDGATELDELIVVDTPLDPEALAEFRRQHPKSKVVSEAPPAGTINPFTGEPL